MAVYEWDIETVDLETGSLHSDTADIIDHNHFDKCPGVPTEPNQRLVLVRDSERDGRLWSYQTPRGDAIDPWMRDAYGVAVVRVPVKYLKEFAAVKASQTVNGYPILMQHKTPAAPMTRAGRVVLVQINNKHTPYVTAWLGDGDASWCSGHYFSDKDEAAQDFDARVKRQY